MKQITCPHCADTYPDFDVAHVCSKGPYALKLKPNMNEKLKEIAVKAQVEHCVSHVRLQEFAELIIKECIKESWDEIVSDEDIAQEKDPLIQEYLKGNNQGIVDAVIRFRNHFGVEQ